MLPDDARIVGVIADSIERGKLDHPGFYRNTQLGEVLRRVLSAALAARQPVYAQGCDELRARTEGERAAYMEGLEEGKKIAARQPVGEPITVEAVAEIFNHPEYGLSIDWLLENGIGELQVGDVLMVSDRAITDEDGSGEVYTAPPAQAVDLGQMPQGIRLIEIPRRNNLDPINVFVQDYELGRGRIVVTCYGQAWCGFWGAMGERTVMQFVAACDADYVAGNMLSGRHEHVKKHERAYVERIATEVIAEFRALIDNQEAGNCPSGVAA
ncbi:hypothetical protein [Stenotrophomonas maltophilia group sp. CASM26]|uniref:hypothetical protein n=1 Tax=Stenotrophomonas maltophilia group sp. CASM26 TaxID=3111514 RepID=UPI003BF90E46